jgi:hypothetical protein
MFDIQSAFPQLAVARNIQKAQTYINIPGDEAYRFYQHYAHASEGRSFSETAVGDFVARCLSIAQVIVCLAAIPLLSLAMVFVPVMFVFTENREIARLYANSIGALLGDTCYQVSESALGVIAPASLVKRNTGPDISDEGIAAARNQTAQALQEMYERGIAQAQQHYLQGTMYNS